MLFGDAKLSSAKRADSQGRIVPENHLSRDLRPGLYQVGQLSRSLAAQAVGLDDPAIGVGLKDALSKYLAFRLGD
jgi:hypothetical protein